MLALCLSGGALAQQLIALHPWEPDDNVISLSFDSDTGIYVFEETVGSTGLAITFSLAWNPIDGNFYALGSEVDSQPYHPRSLYRLDGTDFSAVELIQELEGTDGNLNPNALTIDSSGNFYIFYQSGIIDHFDLATSTSTLHAEIPGQFSIAAVGMTYDFDADRLIVGLEDSPAQLLAVQSNGTVEPLFSFFTPGDRDDCPAQALAYEGAGTIIVGTTYSCDLFYRIDLDAEDVELVAQPNGTPWQNLKSLVLPGAAPPPPPPAPTPLAVPVGGYGLSALLALMIMVMTMVLVKGLRTRS